MAPAIRDSQFLTSIDLSSNNLAGETGYVKANQVQGSSFEVGDKVTYKGLEMIISKGKDHDGDIKMIDLSGVKALADGIAVSRSLTQVLAFLSAITLSTCLSHCPVALHATDQPSRQCHRRLL